MMLRIILLSFVVLMTGSCPNSKNITNTNQSYEILLYAAEDQPYSVIQDTLPSLAELHMSIIVAIQPSQLQSFGLVSLVREANRLNVNVLLWPLLEKEDGYWPNETNVTKFSSQVREILQWLKQENLKANAIVYDMEPAFQYSKALETAFAQGVSSTLELMRAHLDPNEFSEAKQQYIDSVQEVQNAGLKAECVTFPMVLDDLQDNDSDLQDALDIPVDDIPWDKISFMVYQSTFADSVGSWIGPGLIRSYAASAYSKYGERAAVALGIVGNASVMNEESKRYADPNILKEDIAAAIAENIKQIEIFSLDGMIETAQLNNWLTALTQISPKQPKEAPLAQFSRQVFIVLDNMLESPSQDAGQDLHDSGSGL